MFTEVVGTEPTFCYVMSLSNWVVMSVFLLGLLSNANAQTVNSRSEEGNMLPSTASVEITTWQDNKRGACSLLNKF